MTETPLYLTHPLLEAEGIHHGFFTRHGGVSKGVYTSLNGGLGSDDDTETVQRNRHIAASAIGGSVHEISGLFQIHSNIVHDADPKNQRPEGDGLVTDKPCETLTILTADCAPVLLLDHTTRTIAACHAGWRGAVSGIVEATVQHMQAKGSNLSTTVAVIGPTICQTSYQVGADLRDAVLAVSPWATAYFIDDIQGRFKFDLPGYILARLKHLGIESAALGVDTYEDDRFFSHRQATHQHLPDSGRLITMIRRSD